MEGNIQKLNNQKQFVLCGKMRRARLPSLTELPAQLAFGLATLDLWQKITNNSGAQREPEKYPGKEKHMPESVVQKSYFMPDFRDC